MNMPGFRRIDRDSSRLLGPVGLGLLAVALLLQGSIYASVDGTHRRLGVQAWSQGDRSTPARPVAQVGEDHAIYVRDSGAFSDDGVILPVLESLEERYAAANHEFTVEYWFKLSSGYGSNGKELFDHHIPSYEGFWTAFQDGNLWAGIDADPERDDAAIHIQTGSGFADGQWHHYALVRDLVASPHRLCLYLDGVGSCYSDGDKPEWASVAADIRSPHNRNGDDSGNVPLYTIGARTSGGGAITAVIDELRISDTARYHSDFVPPSTPFASDSHTVMLFHFDEGSGNKTYGYASGITGSLEGILVKDVIGDYYGIGAVPLDPSKPAEETWLGQMWVAGRFGTVVSTPELTLTAPNGGEIWTVGTQEQIRWVSSGDVGNVRLECSTDGFATLDTITSSTADNGSYPWTIPDDPSTTVIVRISGVLTPTISDTSDAVFTIARAPSPPLTLSSPNGGELWQTGAQYSIRWTWSDVGISRVNLSYSTDGFATSHPIASAVLNTGSYTWTTPNSPSKTARVRVVDADNTAIRDDSNADFVLASTIFRVYLSPVLNWG